jgi:ABC-type nitrate/sulfonate/bicarbonate transport system substrate-binding protein
VISKANGTFEKAMDPNVEIEWNSFSAGPSPIETLFAGATDIA